MLCHKAFAVEVVFGCCCLKSICPSASVQTRLVSDCCCIIWNVNDYLISPYVMFCVSALAPFVLMSAGITKQRSLTLEWNVHFFRWRLSGSLLSISFQLINCVRQLCQKKHAGRRNFIGFQFRSVMVKTIFEFYFVQRQLILQNVCFSVNFFIQVCLNQDTAYRRNNAAREK